MRSGLVILTFALAIYQVVSTTATARTIMDAFSSKPLKEQFKVYHLVMNKEYDLNSDEGVRRYKNFRANYKQVVEHNERKDVCFTMAINQFSDMTFEEFSQTMLVDPKMFEQQRGRQLKYVDFDSVADDDDDIIVRKGYAANVTDFDHEGLFGPVKNQQSCGSCWAFATSGVVESVANKKNKTSTNKKSFSPQQLVDCDTKNYGCNGGNPGQSFQYIVENGILEESEYPYTGTQGTCKYNDKCRSSYKIKSHKCIVNNYDQYLAALQDQPAVVAVYAESTFMQYSSGEWSSDKCPKDNANHAIVAMGYSTGSGKCGSNSIRIRNSWGSGWGEKGYMKIKVDGLNNACYATYASWNAVPLDN